MHEKAIKNSKTKILALAREEKKLEEELKHLKNKSLKLTIVLQKIAAQPIFSSFLTPTRTLSMARAINLITYLQNELATAEVRLDAKLTESRTLKNKINLERVILILGNHSKINSFLRLISLFELFDKFKLLIRYVNRGNNE